MHYTEVQRHRLIICHLSVMGHPRRHDSLILCIVCELSDPSRLVCSAVSISSFVFIFDGPGLRRVVLGGSKVEDVEFGILRG